MMKASQWIWGTPDARADEYFDFRIPFCPFSANVRLRISCDSNYALWCNGILAGFGQYADYPDYKIFDEFALENVRPGQANELLITAWHYGVDSQTCIAMPAALRFELLEGDAVLAASNPQTLCRRNPNYIPHRCEAITSQLGLTFAYDAAGAPEAWHFSHPVSGMTDCLLPRPVKKLALEDRLPMRIVQQGGFCWQEGDTSAQKMQHAALSVHDMQVQPGEDGVYAIVDMGAETAGFLDIDVDIPYGGRIRIGWGEHLTDGRCRTSVRNFSCEYLAVPGRSRYMNPFRRFGCRYLQLFIEAPAATLHYAGIRPTPYPLTPRPFASGNALRDRIYETCVRTLQLCMHEHYEDCPWREQALYTLDSRNQMLCGYHAFGETEFPRACLELISHGVRSDGLLSLCYPAGLDFPIPAFSLVYFIQMREYLDYSGDIGFLRGKYAMLRRLMERFLQQPRERGLIENFYGAGGFWNFYEWSDGLSGRFNEQRRSLEAPLNAFLSLALQHMAVISERLSQSDDARRWREAANAVNHALAEQFFRAEDGLFASFDDRCHGQYHVLTNALCLLCGAAEGLDKRRLLTVLAANGAADTGLNVVPNTLSMNCFRFDALLAADRAAYAPVILDEIDRTYGAMLDAGATAFWETALGAADFNGAGSLCHGWSALPIYYYSVLLTDAAVSPMH